ncbi:MAG TPA: arginine deiminase family protein [Acidobacteriota bacterium]|nr:arginine deiminase family protein [Acidobacteriota bacterium]
MKHYGCQSMVSPLKRVIVKRPQEAFVNAQQIQSQWKKLNYLDVPNFEKAIAEHEQLVRILRNEGAEVLQLPEDSRTGLDSIYTHDPCIVANAGAIVFQTGKESRRGEGFAMEDFFHKSDIPVLGRIDGVATAEGGDLVWFDEHTLLAGKGFRTNAEGIEKLRALLEPSGVRVVDFDLPYWNGPSDVLHLMSFISLLDSDLAVVYRKQMPAALFQFLESRNVTMVDVAEEEYDKLGCNVLTLSPRRILMIEGSPITRERLKKAGCEVLEFSGIDIGFKGSGGPTCLTRPILRY